MTTVQEPPLAGIPAGGHGHPRADLTRVRFAVEQAMTADPTGCSEAELVDQIAHLEALQHSIAALQATRIRAFARTHVENGIAARRTDPERLERGVIAQIGYACRTSPAEARRRLSVARDLHDGLDHVRGLFTCGELATATVRAVVHECRDLDRDQRARVDARLTEHDLVRLGAGRLTGLVRRIVAEIAPDTFRNRVSTARTQRRVTLRPAPDAMTYLTAYLPVEQGVACYAALDRAHRDVSVSPEPLTRTRGQVMADTLVERLTGRTAAVDVAVEVQVVVPVELLATGDGRRSLRRLLTTEGVVIGGDSRQRTFTGLLATLVRAGSGGRCTEPYCDAPARHIDHIHRHSDGGRTGLDNGRAVCEFHNHVREQPGRHVHRTPDGARTTTPTGHSYLGPDRAREGDGSGVTRRVGPGRRARATAGRRHGRAG